MILKHFNTFFFNRHVQLKLSENHFTKKFLLEIKRKILFYFLLRIIFELDVKLPSRLEQLNLK